MNFIKTLIVLILLIVGTFFAIDKFYFDKDKNSEDEIETVNIKEEEIPQPQSEKSKTEKNKVQKEYATIYFLGVGAEGSAVFKKVKREIPPKSSKIKFAITQLFKGVNYKEKQSGVYRKTQSGNKEIE